MKYRELVAANNPIIYQIIKNAFQAKSISHAYLFSSKNGISVKNEVKFLAQSLISQDPFQSQELRNINNYVDYYEINGEDSLIKKEQVVNAVNKLNEKPFEKNGAKILYIKQIENANKQSLNSLLKFLEEPTNKTYIIFSTNNISSVLNTIKSRCQIINVKNKNENETIKWFNEQGLGLEVSKILVKITNNLEEAKKYNEEEILEIKKEILNSLISSINRGSIYINLINKINKTNYKMYFEILRIFFNDIWKHIIGIQTTFNEKDLYEKYSLINFNYQTALLIVGKFISQQKKLVNFELSKNECLIKLERLYV